MKIVIASDIHGSAKYCRYLMDRINEENPDKVLLLGDILYHGPRNALPEEYSTSAVCEMLNSIADKILWVRGNCDSEVDEMVLKFPVNESPLLIADKGLFMAAIHGHHMETTKTLPPEGGIVLYGHTHVPRDYVEGYIRFINPGSVSIPKENSPHSYILYEDSVFTHKDVTNGKEYEAR